MQTPREPLTPEEQTIFDALQQRHSRRVHRYLARQFSGYDNARIEDHAQSVWLELMAHPASSQAIVNLYRQAQLSEAPEARAALWRYLRTTAFYIANSHVRKASTRSEKGIDPHEGSIGQTAAVGAAYLDLRGMFVALCEQLVPVVRQAGVTVSGPQGDALARAVFDQLVTGDTAVSVATRRGVDRSYLSRTLTELRNRTGLPQTILEAAAMVVLQQSPNGSVDALFGREAA